MTYTHTSIERRSDWGHQDLGAWEYHIIVMPRSGYQQVDGCTYGQPTAISLDDALQNVQLGWFHYRLLIITGLAYMADSIEVSLLSFLSVAVPDEWNLSDAEVASISAVVFGGSLFSGLFIWGPVADSFGRRIAFIAASILVSSAGILSAFAPNLEFLLFMRFCVGIGVGAAFVPFDLLAEYLPPSHRGRFLMNINYFWTLGSVIVAGCAWWLLDTGGWRLLTLISSLPVVAACVLSVIYLPESPRWMMQEGLVDGTIRDIHAAALTNGAVLSDFDLRPLESSGRRGGNDTTTIDKRNLRAEMGRAFTMDMDDGSSHGTDDDNAGSSHSSSRPFIDAHSTASSPVPSARSHSSGIAASLKHYLDLLRDGYQWVTLPLWVIYFCYGFTYYGLVLFVTRIYSEERTGVSAGGQAVRFHYEDIFSAAAVECLGVLLASLLMDSSGRRLPMFAFYAIGAVAVGVLPIQTGKARLALSLVGRVCGIAATGATWVMTPELYPTPLRATGHSSAQCLSRIGAILCPFVVQRRSFSAGSVGLVLGCLNATAAISTLILRETKGISMEQGRDCAAAGNLDRSRTGIDESSVSVDALMACTGRDEVASTAYSQINGMRGSAESGDSDDDVEMIITL